jgi:light-regulated signal transduction histidine kinase (bacteriophytochrome)
VLAHPPKSALGRVIEIVPDEGRSRCGIEKPGRQHTEVHEMKSAQAHIIARNEPRIYSVHDNAASFRTAYAVKLVGVRQGLHSASEFEGTGIRLAPVRRIISAGRLAAERNVDRGAILYFTLRDLALGLEGTSP